MNAPLRAVSFEPTYEHPLARPQHLRPSAQPGRERVVGAAITILAHVAAGAALLLGLHAAERHPAPPPMMVAIEEKRVTPEKLDITMPKFTPPPAVTAPAPMFDIAPSPSAINVPPPRIAAPVATPSPVPSRESGENKASYLGALLAQLNRFKQYPREAKAAHIEGVVMLHFVMDADGKVVSSEIAKSSGRPVLDAEALALIQRAQPLPAIPPDFPTRTLDAVVPIAFSLNA
jgi:protein TonB